MLLNPTWRSERRPQGLVLRCVIVATVLATTSLALTVIATLLYAHLAAAPQSPSPFSTGLRETTPTGAFGALVLAVQSQFYILMMDALSAIKTGASGPWMLIGVGFAYGVFHAAGPGHGKAVIASYLLIDRKTIARGFAVSLAASLVQGLVAVAIVTGVAIVAGGTGATVSLIANRIESLSFAFVAVFGLVLTWRKAGDIAVELNRPTLRAPARQGLVLRPAQCAGCGGWHDAFRADPVGAGHGRTSVVGIILGVGLRPCSGAIILLVFALSQQMYATGILATVAVSLGTAVMTGSLAAGAVFSKAAALRLAGRRKDVAVHILAPAIEIVAGALVFWIGTALLTGLWGGAIAS